MGKNNNQKQKSNGKTGNKPKTAGPKSVSTNRNGKKYGMRDQVEKTGKIQREQPRKDSSSKRVNFDNAREDRVAKQIMKDAKSGRFNDINDFMKNPTLVQAASNIPIFPILGTTDGDMQHPVPGIMQIQWTPNFGNYQLAAPTAYDIEGVETEFTPAPIAINQASDAIYSYVVHANSRNYSYNSSDLTLLEMAGGQVFAFLTAMIRAYGLIKRYVETSTYLPDSLLIAMGFQPENLRQNYARMWFDINMLIIQTRQIWVPDVFPLINRWIETNSKVYKDAEGDYAQLYVFVQTRYFMYNETLSPTGGCLEPAGYIDPTDPKQVVNVFSPGLGVTTATVGSSPYTTYTWEKWVLTAQTMIDRLIKSEDRGIIYGDLLNAYGADRIIALSEISSDYVYEPEYTPEVQMQVENLTSWRGPVPQYLFQIENRLAPGYISNQVFPTTIQSYGPINTLLNFHTTGNPTPEMILLATRFATLGVRAAAMPGLSIPDNSSVNKIVEIDGWIPATAGSEIVTNVTIITTPISTSSGNQNSQAININLNSQYGVDGFTKLELGDIMAFDWHPFMRTLSVVTVPNTPTNAQLKTPVPLNSMGTQFFGDFDKYASVQWSVINKINDVAFMSLFGVPQIVS